MVHRELLRGTLSLSPSGKEGAAEKEAARQLAKIMRHVAQQTSTEKLDTMCERAYEASVQGRAAKQTQVLKHFRLIHFSPA